MLSAVCASASAATAGGRGGLRKTANLRTKILAFRGFDSNIILLLRGGIPRPIDNLPESVRSQAILVRITLVGRLGVSRRNQNNIQDYRASRRCPHEEIQSCEHSADIADRATPTAPRHKMPRVRSMPSLHRNRATASYHNAPNPPHHRDNNNNNNSYIKHVLTIILVTITILAVVI